VTPRRIIGVEKNYDWGDEITIRHSMGLPSTRGEKIAELWCGTHPQGPAHLDRWDGQLLSDVTGEMTMMVKLLACAQPLSLQTHPTAEQAREGFAREEALGIPRDAPQRMYKDESDKPEMIIALSRFEALCGFAPVESSVALLQSMGWSDAATVLASDGISAYLKWAFQQTTNPVFAKAPPWLQAIAKVYAGDAALWIAPLMNHVILNKGEALTLPAGNLHAYLHGFGLEVMNSSDNVIRAGFTSKHVDVNELLRIVDTNTLDLPTVHIGEDGLYPSPSSAFTVGQIHTVDNHIDKHRIVYGLPMSTSWERRIVWPEMYLLPRGESADHFFASGYVCIQN
jgi:mannose-6-phosphate isomerase